MSSSNPASTRTWPPPPWGTQQVNLFPGARYDGVFGMWYGKGPGVDRCGDVFKHANAAGTSPHGGVLVVAGDDHPAKSSTLPHQSDHILKACMIPALFPASVQEVLDYGLHGWAMSRYAGVWVGMKCITDIVEVSASVDVDVERVRILLPEDFQLPPDGLNIRIPDTPLQQEARLLDYKLYAALAYARANQLNREPWHVPVSEARFGIMTSGKAYLDTCQALADLGLSPEVCRRIGLRLFKVGMVWPLESTGTQRFADGLDEILVVEESARCWNTSSRKNCSAGSAAARRSRAWLASSMTRTAANGPCRRATGCCPRTTSSRPPWWPRPSPRGCCASRCPRMCAPASRRGWTPSPRANRRWRARAWSRSASPGSVQAVRTIRPPACRRARAAWPASAATTW